MNGTLVALIAVPAFGGLLAWATERKSAQWPRWISLVALLIQCGLSLALLDQLSPRSPAIFRAAWIPEWGASFSLAADGLSAWLVILTAFLGLVAVLSDWRNVRKRVGLLQLSLLCTISGITGVFLARDLFLFYFFWELMLVPIFFVIALWGHERRRSAAMKFFLFTQAGGLLMLLSVLGLYFMHGHATGVYTFDYGALLGTPMPTAAAKGLGIGFFIAFAVKLPMFPLHPWAPDAYSEAPTPGSVLLGGAMLKTAGYGFIRFVWPLFPLAAARLSPVACSLAIVGILYGSVLAYGQRDLKKWIAYSSISHMGFVLLGIFAGTELALKGAIIQMICHGLSTGALFVMAGAIEDRVHTRDIERLGGLWGVAPRMGSAGLFFALASMGLPGLGNFIGEFLTLLGAFEAKPVYGIVASLAFVLSTVYAASMVQRVFQGRRRPAPLSAAPELDFPDFSFRESLVMAGLMIVLVWIGIYPRPILSSVSDLHPEVRDVRG